MTVIPLFCSRFLKAVPAWRQAKGHRERVRGRTGSIVAFNRGFNHLLNGYERAVRRCLRLPGSLWLLLVGVFVASLVIYPFVGRAFFPQTDAGQFTINIKAPTGTRIEVTNDYVARIEDMIRNVVAPADLKMVLSNIGVVNDISSLYTTNLGQYTATIQVALNDEHRSAAWCTWIAFGTSWPRSSRTCARFSRAARCRTRFSIRACPRLSTCRSTRGISISLTKRRRIWPHVSAICRAWDRSTSRRT